MERPIIYADCCNILGVILCAQVPLSSPVIDALAPPQDRPSLKVVSCLRCIFHVSETERIHIIHPSFHDYLSEWRSDQPWSINLEHHNQKLALSCIKLLDKELWENICDMTLPYLSQKVTLPKASVVGARLSSAPAQLSHQSRFFGSARLPEPAIAGSGYDFEATDALHPVMPPQAL